MALLPERIPGPEFLVTCPACRSVLAVEIRIRKLPFYVGGAEPVAPAAAAQAPSTPRADAGQDDGADRLREMILRLLQRDPQEIAVLDKLTLRAWAVLNNGREDEAEIGSLVRRDQVLSNRIIRLASSSARTGLDPVADIGQALQRVGPETIRKIVLGMYTQRMYRLTGVPDSSLVAGLWDHSVAVATAAQWISSKLAQGDGVQAFQAGLLHDVGRVLALRVLSDAAVRHPQVRRALSPERTSLVIDAHHELLGRLLLEKCGFPLDVSTAAGKHHNPSEIADNHVLPLVVSLADLVARRGGMDVRPAAEGGLAAETLASRLELPKESLAALEVEMEIHQAEMKRLLAA
jgi:putative nucleotidyltransferase with HDIG domain